MTPFLDKVRNRLAARGPIVDLAGDYTQSVFLSSMGRSGSTFVSELINFRNQFRDIFEPFHHGKVPEVSQFVYPFYVSPDDPCPDLLQASRLILAGKIRNPWTERFNRALFPSRRLIKDIRTNLILKWLKRNFPELPMILLLRHPCAVIQSWIQRGFGHADYMRDRLLGDQRLVGEFLAPFEEAYRRVTDEFESLLFAWAIQYYVPLRQFAPGEIHIAFYENFILEPESEIRALFRFIDLEFDERVLDVLEIPSRTTSKSSVVRSGGDLINGWKRKCSAEQAGKCSEVLGLFNLHEIYSEDSVPSREKVLELMGGINAELQAQRGAGRRKPS